MSELLQTHPESQQALPPAEAVFQQDLVQTPEAGDSIRHMYERRLHANSMQLALSGADVERGRATRGEEMRTRASLAQLHYSLNGYIAARLRELGHDGTRNQDVGQVVDEVDALVKLIYATSLEHAGENVSTVRGVLSRAASTPAGRAVGVVAAAGIGLGVGKLTGMGMTEISGRLSDSVEDISSIVGAVTGLVARGAVAKTTESIVKKSVTDKVQEELSPFDSEIVDTVRAFEAEIGEELSGEEKLALARCLKVHHDTRELREEMTAMVGARFMSRHEDEVTDPDVLAAEMSNLTVKHLSEVYGVGEVRQRQYSRSREFFGRLATHMAGAVVHKVTRSDMARGFAEEGTRKVVEA